MSQDASLSLISETEFEFKASPNFPVGCPTLDLCAAWDASDKNLFIYRPQGQVVSKIHQSGKPGSKAPDALTVTWKPDGQFLAVGWSDGVVRLMGLENNKTVHHMDVCEGDARISHIGWAEIVIGKKASEVPQSLKSVMQGTSMPLDLPEELTFLEIDTALPKISPLPTASAGSGDDAVVFTSRTGIEFLFQSPKRSNYDQVNAMIVGTTDGKLHLSVYDAFEIGVFPCPEVNGQTSQLVYHASHPRMSTQALLLSGSDPNSVNFVPMDLPFTSSSPINLSLLTSKLTTLQTLLRYLKQTQLHMQVEWKNARELPSRFLRSVQGDLEENEYGPRSIVPALYHTVVTGHAHKPVQEWLVDIIGERNHKRWDKTVVSALENLRSLVHENFLPSLDRCAIILSRLRGFSQFYSSRDDIGFTSIQISRVLDIISCLSLVGHKILIHVMDELEHFNAFSTWLRFQIDRLANSFSDELTEKEATMDTPKVLAYIEKYLTSSPLDGFFDEVASEDYASDWQHVEDGPSLLHVLDRQLQRREEGQGSMKALPHVDFLVNYATTWSSRIFGDIAEAKKRSVRFGRPVGMGVPGKVSLMDMKMEEGVVVVVLACKEVKGKVYIFKTGLNVVNGISTSTALHSCCVDVDRAIIDVKLLDTKTLMILCTAPDNTSEVLSLPTEGNLTFKPHESAEEIPTTNLADITSTLKYVLPSESAMRPSRMEVHQRRDDRGDIPNRISLLFANRGVWRTFSIPTQ